MTFQKIHGIDNCADLTTTEPNESEIIKNMDIIGAKCQEGRVDIVAKVISDTLSAKDEDKPGGEEGAMKNIQDVKGMDSWQVVA